LVSIYVCHSRLDKWFIEPLEKGLKELHIEPIFIESETPIPKSAPIVFRERIGKASAVYVIWTSNVTNNTITRENVIWEVAQAHALDKPLYVFKETSAPDPTMNISYAILYHQFDGNIQSQVQDALNRAINKAQEIAKLVGVPKGSTIDIEQLSSIRDASFDSTTNCYRSFAIAPEKKNKHVIELSGDTYDWLSGNIPQHLSFGYIRPSQSGAVFGYDSNINAEVSQEGFVYYGELMEQGVYIIRTIVVIGSMLKYAQRIYERFNFYEKLGDEAIVMIRYKLGNANGQKLARNQSDYDRLWHLMYDYIYEGNELVIEREQSFGEIRQAWNTIVESMVIEFCRSFGFMFDDDKKAKDLVTSILQRYVAKVI